MYVQFFWDVQLRACPKDISPQILVTHLHLTRPVSFQPPSLYGTVADRARGCSRIVRLNLETVGAQLFSMQAKISARKNRSCFVL